MKRQHGLSLVELMIAMTLGLIILGTVIAVFSSTSRSRTEMEKSNRQTESGRYASDLLMTNLRMAGYYAEFDPTPLSPPGALPDPCATAVADLLDALPLHVQGIDDAAAAPACLSDLKAGTDILVVRRVSSCIAGAADCAPFAAGVPHFQASLCAPKEGGTELSHTANTNAEFAAHYFTLSTAQADFTKHKTDCVATADIRRYHVDIYFVANNNNAGDGVPTLKRAEIADGKFNIVPLVDGIEDMQVEYGLDATDAMIAANPTDAKNTDGVPDAYTPAPASIAEWQGAMTARAHLLVRNTDISVGHTDTRSYSLGLKADGTPVTRGPYNDRYKRHVFVTTVHFANPSWRRQ